MNHKFIGTTIKQKKIKGRKTIEKFPFVREMTRIQWIQTGEYIPNFVLK